MEHHLCPPADEVVSLCGDVNKTDDIVRMDEEPRLAPPDTHAKCPKITKCPDLISTESEAERDYYKQGKNAKNQNKQKMTNKNTRRAMTT